MARVAGHGDLRVRRVRLADVSDPSTPASPPDRLDTSGGPVGYWSLTRVAELDRLVRIPYVARILLENVLRRQGTGAGPMHVEALLGWPDAPRIEMPFHPGRVVLQDFTGVPVVADLAAMRSAVARLGGDPARVDPLIDTDLVIDHSVQVDAFGSPDAFAKNVVMEYRRNRERYAFLRWAQTAFGRFRVVPPGSGIVHQVNLERLATVVAVDPAEGGEPAARPDTLVGTDSHTTMIGGLGVLGWGVGGIEAEAAMLGEPVSMLVPRIVGVRLSGSMPEGSTATDLVLTLTELLRGVGVVGAFVEFFGRGLGALTVPDRATVSNMSPEYGATEGVFPVDEQVLAYLRGTGRDDEVVDLVERYTRAQGLFHEAGAPEAVYDEVLDFDLSTVEPSLAGPKRPQDRLPLAAVAPAVRRELESAGRPLPASGGHGGNGAGPRDGSVVIAAITSCTNTSNPASMVGAGLLARAAAERGMRVASYVKTSLAPGSPVVMSYLERAGLVGPLRELGFDLVGFGCTTCIGNSGPLPDEVARAIDEGSLSTAAVLSGNRNFEGRIHPQVRMAFLASPALVVAYAIAGRVDVDLTAEPIGTDRDGNDVYLRDLWPSAAEVARTAADAMDPEAYRRGFERIFEGDQQWRSLPVPQGALYEWDPGSTYLTEPPWLEEVTLDPAPLEDVRGARALAVVGDTVTTDHISPAGSIPASSPAGRWLQERGVPPDALHSYGARRGHHEVMVRGTFANIRLRNRMVPGVEGGYTIHLPDGDEMTIYEASMRYREEGVPLVVLAGVEYGAGSSRDWAAKGTALLGVRAVMARSFERIHRSNLVQMGVLPLEFPEGQDAASLGLTGRETFDVEGIAGRTEPGGTVRVVVHREDGTTVELDARSRLDSPADVHFLQQGGILPAVVRSLVSGSD
ncbi:MAG: aconitate hydratase AcnA [Actinobacteria bacterium]|nr:aconitate hydratase AcnA [Actinomycetota bacterium]